MTPKIKKVSETFQSMLKEAREKQDASLERRQQTIQNLWDCLQLPEDVTLEAWCLHEALLEHKIRLIGKGDNHYDIVITPDGEHDDKFLVDNPDANANATIHGMHVGPTKVSFSLEGLLTLLVPQVVSLSRSCSKVIEFPERKSS